VSGQGGQFIDDGIWADSIYCRLDRGGIERIGGDGLGTELRHHTRRFRRSGQRENGVTILFQASDQRPADGAGSTGNQDSHAITVLKEDLQASSTLRPCAAALPRMKSIDWISRAAPNPAASFGPMTALGQQCPKP
jgi:hypothetical protein